LVRDAITIGDAVFQPGAQGTVDLRVPDLYTHTGITLPVYVIHGRHPGPVLFLSGALHGDEINGVEIIRRILHRKFINRLHGTLFAVPVVNIYGFINKTRYLPDRRDLNRSFPGSDHGSLASRMANVILTEIVSKCTHGIDLHSAAIHRDNLPHVRAVLDDPETERMARSFYAPVILDTRIVAGSLRESAEQMKVSVIVYEAGEALRFDEVSIRAGVKGIISTMRELGMLPKLRFRGRETMEPLVARSSTWVRAPQSGIVRSEKSLGARVSQGDRLGVVSDPFGSNAEIIRATADGVIIGRTNIPLVNEGEALFHIARFTQPDTAADKVEEFLNELDPSGDTLPGPDPYII
jgi:predicted deacylase